MTLQLRLGGKYLGHIIDVFQSKEAAELKAGTAHCIVKLTGTYIPTPRNNK
jgi:hypothetical protein